MHRKIFLSIMMSSLSALAVKNIVCDDENAPFLASSSDERGYVKPDDLSFSESIKALTTARAHAICGYYFETNATAFTTKIVESTGALRARTVEQKLDVSSGELKKKVVERDYELKPPWKFGEESYKFVGNSMWYFGHVVSGVAALSFLSYWHYFEEIPTLVAPIFAIAGQLVTIWSRPVERMGIREIQAEDALRKLLTKKKITKIYLENYFEVPHEVFTSIHCSDYAGYQIEL